MVERSVSELLVPPLSGELLRRFSVLPDIQMLNSLFQTKAKALRANPQSHFGISPESSGSWSLAVFELSALERTAVTCPWEKLDVLLETAHAIQLEHKANIQHTIQQRERQTNEISKQTEEQTEERTSDEYQIDSGSNIEYSSSTTNRYTHTHVPQSTPSVSVSCSESSPSESSPASLPSLSPPP